MRSERLVAYAAGSFLIGILLARSRNPLWLLPAAALALYLCAAAHFAGKPKRGLIFCILIGIAAVTGVLRYAAEDAFRERYEPLIKDGTSIRIQGLVYQKESKNQNTIYYLKHSLIQSDRSSIPCNNLQVYLDTDEYPIGATLLVSGDIREFEGALNEGNFDRRLYMESRKIAFSVYGKSAREVGKRRLPLHRMLFRLRQRLRTVFEKNLPETDAGIMTTMLLGDRTALNGDVKELYQASGISHILAISGLHISLIGAMLLRLLRSLRLPLPLCAVISATVMGLYTMMTGSSPSAMRAYLMFLTAITAPLSRRTYDSVTALSLALILLLWENPFLTGYSGFVFSFTAVLSVTAFGSVLMSKPQKIEEAGPGLKEKGRNYLYGRLEALRRTLPAIIALQLVTLPVVMWNYYEIPLYAPFLNLLIVPFLGLILVTGIAGGIAGLFGLGFGTKIVLLIPHYILYLYGHACRFIQKLPGADFITGKPSAVLTAVYYAVLTAAFILMDLVRKRRYTVLPGFLLTIMLLIPKRSGFEMSMLDVGQGDGIYISAPGGTAFVDGGSSNVKQVGKYRIEPFLKAKGERKIDFWLVTHTDADHISGLSEILEENYPVRTLVFSEYVMRDEALEKLIALAKKHGTEISFIGPGQAVHLGKATLTCLFPDRDYSCDDKNGLSLVTLLTIDDFSALLTGDISSREEAYLMENKNTVGILAGTDFYKAAHHGSKYSNSEEFLLLLSPEAAGISCGMGNRYGHPAEEAVSHIKGAGAKVYDTRYSGQIKVTIPGGEMLIQTMK